ncbi:MAG: hypothetical protein QXO62_06690 [Thermoproteota archaeon]
MKVQIVNRKGKNYIRYYEERKPTKAQEEIRKEVRNAIALASILSDEEVAELIGAKVVGKNLLDYNGELLTKYSAMVKFMLKGKKSKHTEKKLPKWMIKLEELLEKTKGEEVVRP